MWYRQSQADRSNPVYEEVLIRYLLEQAVRLKYFNSQNYNPSNFEPSYRTATYNGYLSMDTIYDEIDSFIPEINKHLMITFVPYHSPDQMIPKQFFDLRPFECWDRYWRNAMRGEDRFIKW
jgi:hypothetical protein